MHWVVVISSKLSSTFLFLSLALISSACEKQISKGDELTQAERDYLRQRAALKCIEQTNSDYKSFERSTNDTMLGLERNQTWKYEYKKDNVVVETSYLYVWKVSPPHVYFRLRITEEGSTTNKFYKFDTSSNIDMIRNLQKKRCDKSLDISDSSNSISVRIEEARTRIDDENLSEGEIDYRIPNTYPPFFGNLNRKKTVRTLDNDEKVTKTETFDYVFSTNASTTQPTSYTDPSIVNRKFCIPTFTNPVPPATLNVYDFPFKEQCSATGPDANGDSIPDFDPVELTI